MEESDWERRNREQQEEQRRVHEEYARRDREREAQRTRDAEAAQRFRVGIGGDIHDKYTGNVVGNTYSPQFAGLSGSGLQTEASLVSARQSIASSNPESRHVIGARSGDHGGSGTRSIMRTKTTYSAPEPDWQWSEADIKLVKNIGIGIAAMSAAVVVAMTGFHIVKSISQSVSENLDSAAKNKRDLVIAVNELKKDSGLARALSLNSSNAEIARAVKLTCSISAAPLNPNTIRYCQKSMRDIESDVRWPWSVETPMVAMMDINATITVPRMEVITLEEARAWFATANAAKSVAVPAPH